MQALGLVDAVSDLRATHRQQQAPNTSKPPQQRSFKPRAAATAAQPTRRSLRGGGSTLETTASAPAAQQAPAPALLTLQEYFQANDIDYSDAIRAEGFRGWVNPSVREEFGIASNADEAWQSQGGGKFTRKIDKKGPTHYWLCFPSYLATTIPCPAAIPAHIKAKGWSDAKAMAATQLLKNPNQYFYRHTAPGVPQAQGDWSAEEHEAFVATMRTHGVGDKWCVLVGTLVAGFCDGIGTVMQGPLCELHPQPCGLPVQRILPRRDCAQWAGAGRPVPTDTGREGTIRRLMSLKASTQDGCNTTNPIK